MAVQITNPSSSSNSSGTSTIPTDTIPLSVNIVTPQIKSANSGDQNLYLTPAGTGAISAQIPDNTVVGGNARGAYAVDLQTSRDDASQVASGEHSFTQGISNTASESYAFAQGTNNTASGYSAFAQGSYNTASEGYAFAQGSYNTASEGYAFAQGEGNIAGYSAFAQGTNNTASGGGSAFAQGNSNTAGYSAFAQGNSNTAGYSAFAQGDSNIAGYFAFAQGTSNIASGYTAFAQGANNTASGDSAFAQGFQCNISGNSSAGFSLAQDRGISSSFWLPNARDSKHQRGDLTLSRIAASASSEMLLSDNTSSITATTANQLTLQDYSVLIAEGTVVARDSTDAKSWTFAVTLTRDADAASTAILGVAVITPQHASAGAAMWDVTLAADTTLGCLNVSTATNTDAVVMCSIKFTEAAI